ncbi:MAG: hypothetical protein PUP91_32100 [Rhizonema sp. PD37]|nr:hypothetical protein [Rhizonema sp. PD37]
MSEQSVVSNQSQNDGDRCFSEVSITEFLQEIEQTPRDEWSNLLQIIRLFRESVTRKSELLQALEQKTTLDILEVEQLTQQHKALSQQNNQWIEEGNQQEQTETWEFLRQALNENLVY